MDISEWKRREKEAQKYIALMTSMCSQGIVNPPSLTQWKGQMLYYLNVESAWVMERNKMMQFEAIWSGGECCWRWGCERVGLGRGDVVDACVCILLFAYGCYVLKKKKEYK